MKIPYEIRKYRRKTEFIPRSRTITINCVQYFVGRNLLQLRPDWNQRAFPVCYLECTVEGKKEISIAGRQFLTDIPKFKKKIDSYWNVSATQHGQPIKQNWEWTKLIIQFNMLPSISSSCIKLLLSIIMFL